MYLRLAWRNIWRNKRRTLITTASVFLAVVLACIMRSAQFGAYNSMINNVVSFYYGYVQVHAKGYWDEHSLDYAFTPDDSLRQALRGTGGISNWVPRVESFALASAGTETKGTLVAGIDPDKEKTLTHIDRKISSGNYLSANDEGILVSEGLASSLKLHTGDTIVLLGQGYHGSTAAGKYPIRGIITFGSPELNDGIVYLSLEQAGLLYGTGDMLTSIAIDITHAGDAESVANQLRMKLPASEYEVMNWKQMMPDLVQVIEADSSGGIIFLAILYMIIAFGLFGTVLMMLAERSHEFGIMTAIGMKKLKLAGIVTLEIFMMSFIGVILGAAAAVPVIWYFREHPIRLSGQMAEAYKSFGLEPIFPFAADPHIFFSQAEVVFIICMLLAVYPVVTLLRMKTINALKN